MDIGYLGSFGLRSNSYQSTFLFPSNKSPSLQGFCGLLFFWGDIFQLSAFDQASLRRNPFIFCASIEQERFPGGVLLRGGKSPGS